MSNDDKYGIGAGLMALGLAAGVILLCQLPLPHVLAFLPHRDPNTAEMIFDGILCALALPAGIFVFALAIISGPAEPEASKKA